MNTPNDDNSKTDSTEAQERAGVVLGALPGSASFPRVPATIAQLKTHGRWWWFCEEATMKDIQPVLVTYEDKYDPESPCYFAHPWPHTAWENDKDRPQWSEQSRWVKNWEKCFFGPCIFAEEIGAKLEG